MARRRIRLPETFPAAPDLDDPLAPDLDPEADSESAAAAETYYRSRQRKETALADLRQLEVLRRAGELLPVAQVSAAWTRRIQATRSALLALPGRVRARCPGVDDMVIRAIDEELRQLLVQVADDWRHGD